MQLDWHNYTPGKDATVIRTLDVHAGGEPLRIVTGGMPELPGATILARRRYMQEHYDHIRRALMWEPRGHYDMYGCLLTSPVTPEADLGVLFMHNEGYSTMCGHGIIGLVTALLETGAIPSKGQHTAVNLDTPAGLVRATAHLDDGHISSVSFLNVPSFLYTRDVALDVADYGRLTIDIAFGGAFYGFLAVEQVGLQVKPLYTAELVKANEAITSAINAQLPVVHPLEADLSFVYGTIFTDLPEDPAHHSRNCCVFANGEVDRSPTGTGVSARVALHAAKGEIADDQVIHIESILGAKSVFSGCIAEQTHVGKYDAVVPEISGRAFITGQHEFIIDPSDELGRGFLVK
ncbi:MAG TPA: proline racemase family protein [Ktedonobacteraceae bacterium]|nr:proline racemase family protein [Ktedonobacteraceae bacterium]